MHCRRARIDAGTLRVANVARAASQQVARVDVDQAAAASAVPGGFSRPHLLAVVAQDVSWPHKWLPVAQHHVVVTARHDVVAGALAGGSDGAHKSERARSE